MTLHHNESEPADQQPPKPGSRRLFLAIELSEEVRAAITDLSSRLQKAVHFTPARMVWVPPQNFHLTLYFLGNVDNPEALAAQLPAMVESITPFDVDVRHTGLFPPRSNAPKVLWVGVHNPSPTLAALRERCAEKLTQLGLPVQEGDFIPHVTIARFKSSKGARAVINLLKDYRFVKLGKSPATALTLMESHTGGGPARYVPFAREEFPPSLAS